MTPIFLSKLMFGIFGGMCVLFVLWAGSGIVIYYIRRRQIEKEIQKAEEAARRSQILDAWEQRYDELNKR